MPDITEPPNEQAPISGQLGKQLEGTARGFGAIMNEFANNKGGRAVIGVLIAVIVGVGYLWWTDHNSYRANAVTQQTKIDAGTQLLIDELRRQLTEKDKTIEKKDIEFSGSKDIIREQTGTIQRLTNALEICQSSKK